jgi:hypothetical protein
LAARKGASQIDAEAAHKPSVIIGEPVRIVCTPGSADIDVYPIRVCRAKTIAFDIWLIKEGKQEGAGDFKLEWGEWQPEQEAINGQFVFSLQPSAGTGTGTGRWRKASAGVAFVGNTPAVTRVLGDSPEIESWSRSWKEFRGTIPAKQIQVIRTEAMGGKEGTVVSGTASIESLDAVLQQSRKHAGVTFLVITALWEPAP